jgi:hypothetical protein
MRIKQLEAKHPEHEGDLWRDYEALYRGGKDFRRRVHRFLKQNPKEPLQVYENRKAEAVYRSYIGTVIDYFAALLFSVPLIYTPHLPDSDDDTEPPEWLADIEDDCDGSGTDLVEFLRLSLIDSMVKRSSWWLLDYPDNYGSGSNRIEADQLGATDVRLRRLCRENVNDWSRDKRGRLTWAIVRHEEKPRETPSDTRGLTLITWMVCDRHQIDYYSVELKDGERLNEEADVQPYRTVRHGLGDVPIVELDVNDGLWVANRLESPQLEHFRLSSANNWSIRRTCYAMPVFKVAEPESFGTKAMGAGYWIAIGKDESAEWIAPPTAHLAHTSKEIDAQKDEIFRLVTQMSLGVDNNAAAIGRSAESKIADAEAIQVVLRAYGARIRDVLKRTLHLLSKARGDALDWNVEGLDKFETVPAAALLEGLKIAMEIGVPSKTFKVEAKYRAATGLLPGLDQATKQLILDEIEVGVDEEDEQDEELRDMVRSAQKLKAIDQATSHGSDSDADEKPGRGKPEPARES